MVHAIFSNNLDKEKSRSVSSQFKFFYLACRRTAPAFYKGTISLHDDDVCLGSGEEGKLDIDFTGGGAWIRGHFMDIDQS